MKVQTLQPGPQYTPTKTSAKNPLQRALSFVPTPIPYNVNPTDFMLFLSTKTKTSITSPASLSKVLKFGAPPMTSSEANKDSKVLHHQYPSIATSSLTL